MEDRRNINRRKRYQENREIINREKARPCVDCGIQYNPWIMQFDHRDPKDKAFAIGAGKIPSREALIAEIKKCQVVCSNCHAERSHKQRIEKKFLDAVNDPQLRLL
jgi:hypothetical protein